MTSVSVEEYLRTSYEPEMEYVDGQLVDRHVGEYDHSLMQAMIASNCAPGSESAGSTRLSPCEFVWAIRRDTGSRTFA